MEHDYKKAIPDIDSSYVKYVVSKTVKPTFNVLSNAVIGVIACAALLAIGWCATVGVWRTGFYIGGYLFDLFDITKIHDNEYQWRVGPGPWFFGVAMVAVPFIVYKIGRSVKESIF